MSLLELTILTTVAVLAIAIGLWVFWKVIDAAIGTIKVLSWLLAIGVIVALFYFGWQNILET